MNSIFRFIIVIMLAVTILPTNGFLNPALAYTMSSGGYRIESDSDLGTTGGTGSTTNYVFRDTMGEVSSGGSSSTLFKLKAGYQEMQEVFISVSSPADINLGSIPGITGGTVNGTVYWNVNADGSAGFDMKLSAGTIPAMKLDASYYMDNYSTTPTLGWTVNSGEAKFGYTVIPATTADAVASFKDNGASCGGGGNAGNCWAGFDSTNQTSVIHRTTRTDPAGETEGIKFQVQSNNKLLKDGDYSAQITTTISSN